MYFFDERAIVGLLAAPFAPLVHWAVRLFYFLVHFAHVAWSWTKEKKVVPRIGLEPDEQFLLYSAVELAEGIRNKTFSASRVIEAYIRRIELVNPLLNAVVQRNYEDARQRARDLDDYLAVLKPGSDEYQQMIENKPLLGVPFTLKDQFHVKGLRTTAGLACRKDAPLSTEDAGLVEALRAAGAIPLCISNVPEGLMHMTSDSAVYGTTNNPYDSRTTCGGSSGGEGALVAAAASVIGIGSDIGGSIRIPSLFCGVFGLKPSPGLADLRGGVPDSLPPSMEEMVGIGPICRYARDLRTVFKVFIGPKNATRLRLDKPVQLEAVRLFSMAGTGNQLVCPPLDADVLRAHTTAIEVLEKATKRSAVPVAFPLAKHAGDFWFAMFAEGGFPISHFFKGFSKEEKLDLFAEIPRWLRGTSEHTSPAIVSCAMEWFADHFAVFDREQVLKSRDKLRAQIVEMLADNGVLIWPSFPQAAYVHNELIWSFLHTEMTAIWNALALPAVACPVGLNADGHPLGVQLVAGPDNERLLIALAEVLEQELGGWKMPPGPSA